MPKPVTEFQFHPKRKWRIDYYFDRDNQKVALEVEGGVWTKGRHTRGSGFIKDIEKYNAMMLLDWSLLRFVPSDKDKIETLATIKELVKLRKQLAVK